jgi:hypothetical protein
VVQIQKVIKKFLISFVCLGCGALDHCDAYFWGVLQLNVLRRWSTA